MLKIMILYYLLMVVMMDYNVIELLLIKALISSNDQGYILVEIGHDQANYVEKYLLIAAFYL